MNRRYPLQALWKIRRCQEMTARRRWLETQRAVEAARTQIKHRRRVWATLAKARATLEVCLTQRGSVRELTARRSRLVAMDRRLQDLSRWTEGQHRRIQKIALRVQRQRIQWYQTHHRWRIVDQHRVQWQRRLRRRQIRRLDSTL